MDAHRRRAGDVPARAHPSAAWTDPVLVAVLAVADLALFSAPLPARAWWEPAYLVLGFLPLLWRRRAPRAVLAAVLAHVLGAALLLPDHLPALAVVAALYTVASRCSHRSAAVALLLAALVYVPPSTASEIRSTAPDDPVAASAVIALLLLALLCTAAAVGTWAQRGHRRLLALEAQQERAAQEAVAAERRRMARELHDVVSHSVSIMVLQAAGARRILPVDAARAEQALAEIEALGKQSMTELRRLLGLLRDGALVQPGDDDGLGGRAGTALLPELLDGFRTAGFPVRREVVGRPVPLDGSVDLSAYRIVQEALTNARKHAGSGADVAVREVWSPDVLLLEVVDDGNGSVPEPGLGAGYGLVGLRERVRAVGGSFEAGPLPDGGFRVRATLPVRADSAPSGARLRAGSR